MYRINVLTGGTMGDVTTGPRYCLLKRDAKRLIDFFIDKFGCEISVAKFVRIHDSIWVWSENEYEEPVIDYYYNKLAEEDE